MGRFINADAFATTGQGLLGNNMFAYCLNNPIVNIDPTGEWSWIGAILGGVTSAIGAVMNGGSLGNIIIETAIGVASGGCQSILGSLLSVTAETVYTIVSSDKSDPVYLSLLLSIFSSQINGDNLNLLLKNALDSDTINLFDWVFGTGKDLCVSGIDLLLQDCYGGKEKGLESLNLTKEKSTSTAANTNSNFGGSGSTFHGNNLFAAVCAY